MIDPITVLGLIAASLTTGALVPQTIKTWKTRSAGDLSMYMYLMMVTGVTCWLVYGIYKNDIPLILANGIGMLLSGAILYFNLKETLQKTNADRT